MCAVDHATAVDLHCISVVVSVCLFFFFKQKTAYEIYQCDWSSDVCSSDLKSFDAPCLPFWQHSSDYLSQYSIRPSRMKWAMNRICDRVDFKMLFIKIYCLV